MISEPHPEPKAQVDPRFVVSRRKERNSVQYGRGGNLQESTPPKYDGGRRKLEIQPYPQAPQSEFGGQHSHEGQARPGGLSCGGCNGSIVGRIVGQNGIWPVSVVRLVMSRWKMFV